MAQDVTSTPASVAAAVGQRADASLWQQQVLEAVQRRKAGADGVDASGTLEAAIVWATNVPAGYAETVSARSAAEDFLALAQLGTDTALRADLRPNDVADGDVGVGSDQDGAAGRGASNHDDTPAGATWRFVLHHREPRVLPLSSFLPVLESFGFTVIAENAFRLPDPPRRAVDQGRDRG